MSRIVPGRGMDINRVADGTWEEWEDNITITKVLVGSVMEVRITHPEMVAQIGEVKYTIPAATKSVNTADVAAFTTYHCYYELVAGVMTFVATTTSPDLTTPEPEYAWLRQIRFKSVSGTATIEFVQRQIMCHDEALHCLGDSAYLMPPQYVSGFGPTISLVDGTVDVEAGNYRRMVGYNRTRAAITDGVMYAPVIDTVYANLAEIAKYSDGSAITAAKYFKVLIGVLVNAESDYDLIVNVQGKPSTEYVSAAEAWSDSERKASIGFSSTRRSAVLPLAWVVMKKADASTIVYADIRETGLAFASGGVAGVTDHGALTGLTDYADHPGFLLKDGSRALTGNLTVDPGVTIDGKDLSALVASDITDFVEAAQDAVGAMVANSNSIELAYVDGVPSLKATLVLKEAALPLANGANNDVDVSGGDLLVISGPTSAFSITGLAGGTAGKQVIIHNQTSQRMTIARESSSSVAANRILTGTGSDIQTAAGTGTTGSVTLTYSAILSRWIVSSWIA